MKDRKLINVIYEYDNGDKEFIDGTSLENFQKNMELGGSCVTIHSFMGEFLPVEWKKITK